MDKNGEPCTVTSPTKPVDSPTSALCAMLPYAQLVRAQRQSAYASLSLITLSCADADVLYSDLSKALPDAISARLEDFSEIFSERSAGLPSVRGGASHLRNMLSLLSRLCTA